MEEQSQEPFGPITRRNIVKKAALATFVVGGVVGFFHNRHQKRKKETLTIINILMHHDDEIEWTQEKVKSVIGMLDPIVDYMFQQEIDKEFVSIVEENLNDLG